jgi:YidC/Oxa1 family membrane protein insertase
MEFLSNMMLEALRFFAFFGGYGWGIVWLTIAVNLALYPLTLTSIKSMSAMQRLQPRLQEIQKKYKDKPAELQKETMDAYRAEGVNPMGGCLPILIKIPFFLALFWVLQSPAFMAITSDPKNEAGFLWINAEIGQSLEAAPGLTKKLLSQKIIVKKANNRYIWNNNMELGKKKLTDILANKQADKVTDIKALRAEIKGLSEEDAIATMQAWQETNNLAKPEKLRFGGVEISIFAILIGISTYFMQKTMPGAMTQQTQMMNTIMPLFIAVISWNFPAGVQIYWLVSNLIGTAQQYYIMKKPKNKTKVTLKDKEEQI